MRISFWLGGGGCVAIGILCTIYPGTRSWAHLIGPGCIVAAFFVVNALFSHLRPEFKCAECDAVLGDEQMTSGKWRDGPVVFTCERCQIEWDTGTSRASGS